MKTVFKTKPLSNRARRELTDLANGLGLRSVPHCNWANKSSLVIMNHVVYNLVLGSTDYNGVGATTLSLGEIKRILIKISGIWK